MTDYLERLEEESMDALLEQTRRMERILSGLIGRTAGEDDVSSPAGQTPREADEGTHAAALESVEEDRELFRTKGEAPLLFQTQGDAGEEERFPLLEQLRQLEWAAELPAVGRQTEGVSAAGVWSRPWDGQGGSTLLPGADRRTMSGDITSLSQSASALAADPAGRENLAYAGALSWAEQADRVFRRDSRRYDGGFYLY